MLTLYQLSSRHGLITFFSHVHEKAYKQFGSRVKAVKRKLEEVSVTLPSAHQSNRSVSPVIDAPSPSSSAGSDLELPDAFAAPIPPSASVTTPQENSGHHSPFGMDLDSRITSFLSAGAQPVSFHFLGNL